MPWSGGYESAKQGLASQMGTLAQLAASMAQLKQQKKQNWMQLLNTGVGIAGDIGGGFLQNKWNKEAAATKFAGEKELKGIDAQNEALKATINAARGKSAYQQQQGDIFAEKQLEREQALDPNDPEYQLKMAQAGYYGRMPGEGTEGKTIPWSEGEYAMSQWEGYKQTNAAYKQGIIGLKGEYLPDKLTPEVRQNFINWSFNNAKSKAAESGITLDKSTWEAIVDRTLGFNIIEPPAPKVEEKLPFMTKQEYWDIGKQLNALYNTVQEQAKLKGKEKETQKLYTEIFARPMGRPLSEVQIGQALKKLQEYYNKLQMVPNIGGMNFGSQGELMIPGK